MASDSYRNALPLQSMLQEYRLEAVLGAGGSARAVAIALASREALVTVHARQRPAAAAVAALATGDVGDWPPQQGSWDLLVNCTPLGMHPDISGSPLPASSLDGALVYDLIYNPGETRLLREATAAGCQTIGGLDMLVAQAEAQCQWWTGRTPPEGIMRMAALDRTILRVAVEEVVYRDDVPASVAISEAVEAASDLSTEESKGFVNGILGGIARGA